MVAVDLVTLGVLIVFAGFGVMAAALLLEGRKSGEVKGGGVVLVGPIPIIFGSDAKWGSIAIILAIVLIFVTLLLYSV